MGRNLVLAVLVVGSVACGGQVLEPVESWGEGGSGGATGGEGGVSQTGGTGGSAATGGFGGSAATGGFGGSAATGGTETGGMGGTGDTTGGSGGSDGGGAAGMSGGASGYGYECEGELPPGSSPPTVSPECEGTEPSKMVTLPGGFAIDVTEVTRCQYQVWLATGPSAGAQPAGCDYCGFTPHEEWPPNGKGDHPVVGVDWCDAYAYCAGVGKRLCGGMEGPTNYDLAGDPAASQWMNACSSGGKYETVAGGSMTSTAACNVAGSGTVPVASLPECQSPEPAYAGVYDLSGNVSEWVDFCREDPESDEVRCVAQGGSYQFYFALACHKYFFEQYPRRYKSKYVGFRCCSDATSTP